MGTDCAREIATQIQRLSDCPLGTVNREASATRRAWVAPNRRRVGARVVAETAARGKVRILVPAAEIIGRCPAVIDVVPGVFAEECLALYW